VTTNACPGPEDLLALLHGEGDPGLEGHVDACAVCRRRAAELGRLESAVRASAPERHSAVCPPPDTFRSFLAGRLAPEARQDLEAHAARCRRCLDVLAAAHDETVLERMGLPAPLRERLEALAPLGVEEVPTRPAVRPRTRRHRLHRLLGADRPAWVPFAAAAALFLGFVAIVVVSTSSPSRPAPKPGIAVAPPDEPEEDPAAVERAIAEAQERIRRQREERAQAERELRRRQAELEALEETRRKQEEQRRLARQEEERRKLDLELQRLADQKRVAAAELEKAKENEQRVVVESRVAAGIVAHVERVQGQVFLVDGATRKPARAKDPVASGQGVETQGRGSLAVLRYLDKTRLELAADVQLRELAEREAEGKRVHLLQGVLTAEVTKQPAGRPMIFKTPHGEATVLGTTLRLLVEDVSTRLEVTEGRVRLTRAFDGKSVEVPSGHFAVAAAGLDLVARAMPRAMLVEDFEQARAVDRTWRLLFVGKDVSAALLDGRLDISLPPGSTRSNVQGEVHTRLSYRAPLRVSVDVEISHSHPDLLAGFTFVPAASEPKRDNKDAILFTLAGSRRGLSFGLGNWGWKGLQNANVSVPAPHREQWTLELDGDDVRVLVDGKETFRRKHGGKVHTHYHLRLEGTALTGPNLPPGAYVRFDNVRVEPLTR
jgi:ferric-dicitrate binding protein FerR (iron transport regulator)